MSGEFVDSNVLVYAHDRSAGEKHKAAFALVTRLALDRTGLLSMQVLSEFYVVSTRKIPNPISETLALQIIENFGHWPVFSPRVADLKEAIRIARQYRINFWDGMIVRAAAALGASALWSEDFSEGRIYEGVLVRNPFEGLRP